MRLGRYLKAAFLNRWNLLFFGGGMALAFLTGRPDVFAPLVLAGEVAYVGLLGTHPRFQKHVDAQEAKAMRLEGAAGAEAALERMLDGLPPKSLARFEALRTRCLELRQIAVEIKDPGRTGEMPLEALQLAGLDRLLWIYLRLLFTHYSLERFLQTASDAEIRRDIERLEGRLQRLAGDAVEPQEERIRKALEDNLETTKSRLANIEKARSNHELMQLEIDRLEAKIRSLSEMAINRQEPEFISGQVDQAAASMLQTEKTMNELRFATGIEMVDEVVPELLRRRAIRAKE
jgi:hypothetical protein